MRVLLDECVHAGVKRVFPGHTVQTVPEAGWSGIKNGRLLNLMADHFDVFLTIDQNIRHQQNLTNLPFAIVFVSVPNNMLDSHLPLFELIRTSVERARAGEIKTIP